MIAHVSDYYRPLWSEYIERYSVLTLSIGALAAQFRAAINLRRFAQEAQPGCEAPCIRALHSVRQFLSSKMPIDTKLLGEVEASVVTLEADSHLLASLAQESQSGIWHLLGGVMRQDVGEIAATLTYSLNTALSLVEFEDPEVWYAQTGAIYSHTLAEPIERMMQANDLQLAAERVQMFQTESSSWWYPAVSNVGLLAR